ncbi:MAG: tRNA dimethylallyltransferase [Candidatus Woesebacteria bacterium GW2011_GWB1_41_10]|uniref:tRNA dimethylallyltransferase n=1 Tax=Candidatus Woesebacteria bacterium GW2011_GWB1_41_10 TaxID=1618577 RepID=A0A0G0UIH5_9BACT|nr:MAG: tRNA dimethylallyltransferase [Candidatus Woesebacteria bacterium GW2011_GWB1_41_10]
MKKLLVICGPTATGKTALAIKLAKKFDGEIVSADSRQVYKGMDIGMGKEWGDVPIHGYDLVDPRREFSVSKYLKFARKILKDIWRRGKLPILVGGTGLYIKGVVDGIPTVEVPRNNELRKRLEEKSADELFESLSQLDAVRAGSMNSSDRKNPRRLVRAIEVAQWNLGHGVKCLTSDILHPTSVLVIGLTAAKEPLNKRIEDRVGERVKAGIKKEIESLLKNGVSWDDQSMMSFGYRQYRDFFEGEVPEEVVVSEWTREEQKYAKRQMTWFKKDKRVGWFDIFEVDYQKKVEKMVAKWYPLSRA